MFAPMAEAAKGSAIVVDALRMALAEGLIDASLDVKRAVAAALAKQGKDAEIVWPKIAEAIAAKDSDPAGYR